MYISNDDQSQELYTLSVMPGGYHRDQVSTKMWTDQPAGSWDDRQPKHIAQAITGYG